MPWEIIEAFAVLKMAAAETNHELGVLSKEKNENYNFSLWRNIRW